MTPEGPSSTMAPKLILTGFMASGKSAVGRATAARLGWRLVDSDAELAARAGKPIPAIFAEHGEAHFRALEREVIAAIGGRSRALSAMRRAAPGGYLDRRRRAGRRAQLSSPSSARA